VERKHVDVYEFPTEKQIKDKSKADWVAKTMAVVQILRLLCSMASRAVLELPISQLEVCTADFSILAIATYLANWNKPKDVEVSIHVLKPGKYHIGFDPLPAYGAAYLTMHFKQLDWNWKIHISRIANDPI
jgi:hypothetical protein